eukprot:6072123-Pleurochrysis_carterae.AAC.1
MEAVLKRRLAAALSSCSPTRVDPRREVTSLVRPSLLPEREWEEASLRPCSSGRPVSPCFAFRWMCILAMASYTP